MVPNPWFIGLNGVGIGQTLTLFDMISKLSGAKNAFFDKYVKIVELGSEIPEMPATDLAPWLENNLIN